MAMPSLVTPTWTDYLVGTGASATLNGQPYTGATYTSAFVVIALRTATVTVDSVFFGADAMTKKQEVSNGTDIKLSVWEITGAARDTVDVVATFSGSTEFQIFCSFVTNTLSYRGGATNSGTDTAPTINTSAGSGTLLLGSVAVGAAALTTLAEGPNQTEWYSQSGTETIMQTDYKTSRTTGASFGWTLGASKAWATAYIEYNQLPTDLAVDASASPTLTDNFVVLPGFVVRETVQIDTTVEDTVEVM